MLIKRVNEWITSKRSEYTKLHAFINCQRLRLTASRGSFENIPSEIQQENGVFSILMQLSSYDESLFPFTIIDYDTHTGIDVIVKGQDNMPVKTSKMYYIEFKNYYHIITVELEKGNLIGTEIPGLRIPTNQEIIKLVEAYCM